MVENIKEKNYEWEYIDHNMNIACDPNNFNIEDQLGFFRGSYSVLRRCLYGKEIIDYSVEYKFPWSRAHW